MNESSPSENQFSKEILRINAEKEVKKVSSQLRSLLSRQFKRRGYVVGLSGGIDSSVTAALAAKSVGPERVLALLMPERHSSDDTLALSASVADHFGIPKVHEDITGILEAVGFYHRYGDAVRQSIPQYGKGWLRHRNRHTDRQTFPHHLPQRLALEFHSPVQPLPQPPRHRRYP